MFPTVQTERAHCVHSKAYQRWYTHTLAKVALLLYKRNLPRDFAAKADRLRLYIPALTLSSYTCVPLIRWTEDQPESAVSLPTLFNPLPPSSWCPFTPSARPIHPLVGLCKNFKMSTNSLTFSPLVSMLVSPFVWLIRFSRFVNICHLINCTSLQCRVFLKNVPSFWKMFARKALREDS